MSKRQKNVIFQLNSFCITTNRGGGGGGGGLGGTVVTHSPPTPEVSGSNPIPYVGKLVVAYRWAVVYSTKL